ESCVPDSCRHAQWVWIARESLEEWQNEAVVRGQRHLMALSLQDVHLGRCARLESAQLVIGVNRGGGRDTRIFLAMQKKHRDSEQVLHGQLDSAGRVAARTHQRCDGGKAI